MKIFKNLVMGIRQILGGNDYNKGFAQCNQPCFTKDGKFIGWFSRSMATALFVFCRDKNGILYVLASERGKGAADFQGYWNCPCGYLDFNETTKQCALREMREETGVVIDESKLKFINYEDDPITANHQNVTFRFGALIDDATIEDIHFTKKENEKDEVGQIAWLPVKDIDKYQWAFNHKTRIVEIGRELQLI